MQERKTTYILMYLACEQTIFVVGQLQRKNWIKQPAREWCTRARQPLKQLCIGVRQLLIEDLCVGVRELRQEGMNRSKTAPNGWMLFIESRQLSMNKCSWN
jgi:hypothetical protein